MRTDRRLDRRQFLAFGAAGGALLTAPARRARAFSVGDGEVLSVSDGSFSRPPSMDGLDPTDPELRALFAASGIDPGAPRQAPLNLTLYRDAERTVLFDVGSGSGFLAGTGALLNSLEALGIGAEQITDVLFTHAHPDHLWGVIDEWDEATFPAARYAISAAEWDFWTDPGTVSAMPEDRVAFAVGAARNLAFIEQRVERFGPGEEVLPGIEAIATPGHTPGHTSFALHAGSESVVVIGDALTHELLSFARPGWHIATDQDPARAAATRAALLDRLAADRSPAIGYHLAGDGIGRVERADDGSFRWLARG